MSSRFPEETESVATSSWTRFSLRTLLVAMLVVAAYFGGRESGYLSGWFAPDLEGAWEMALPAGFRRPTTLTRLEGRRYLLRNGGVLSGIYERRGDQLVVVEPNDKRMRGLTWAWDGSRLTLVAEPPSRPTGASYVGAILRRPSGSGSAGAEPDARRGPALSP